MSCPQFFTVLRPAMPGEINRYITSVGMGTNWSVPGMDGMLTASPKYWRWRHEGYSQSGEPHQQSPSSVTKAFLQRRQLSKSQSCNSLCDSSWLTTNIPLSSVSNRH